MKQDGYVKVDELLKAQDEYIKILEEACGSLAGFASVHGVNASNEEIQSGIDARKKIKDLRNPVEEKEE